MAYQFSKKPVGTFRFITTDTKPTEKITLSGINATLTSAEIICDGTASLMAIGANYPEFEGAERTAQETVSDDGE